MPDRGDQVAVALEHVVVANEEDRHREQGRAGDEDRRLLQGQAVVDPEQHHEADRREQRAEREQVRVGVGQPGADEQVDAEADGEEVAAVDQAEVADLVRLDDEHRREPGGDQQPRPGAAPGARGCARSLPCLRPPALGARAAAASCARRPAALPPGLARLLLRRSPRRASACGPAARAAAWRSSSRVTASSWERSVWLVALSRRSAGIALDLDRGGVDLRVELDPQRQVVRQAAVERQPPAGVGAEEVDLAHARRRRRRRSRPTIATAASDLGEPARPAAARPGAAARRAASRVARLARSAAAATRSAVSPASSAAGPTRVGCSSTSAATSASSSRKATTVMLSRPPASLASRDEAATTASSRLSALGERWPRSGPPGPSSSGRRSRAGRRRPAAPGRSSCRPRPRARGPAPG